MTRALAPEDFKALAELLKRRAGLVVGSEKTYLVESRLAPVARRWSFASVAELLAKLRERGERADAKLVTEVIEAMTTNESFFFRDTKPFDLLREKVLPRLLAARSASRRLRIWSAACSTGQEPYSIAMILKEMGARLDGWHVEILATDIANHVLTRAKEGVYTQFEVQRGLPIQYLVKYFTQDGDRWILAPEIRRMVTFRLQNLLEESQSFGRFDVILCRNVLIYFDQPTKALVLDRLADRLAPDGVLMLGGAETILGLSERLRVVPEERGLYAPVVGEKAEVARPA